MKVIEQSAHDFFYEHVYCLYSKQKVVVPLPPDVQYEDALSLLNTRNCESSNAMLLKAQVLYRLERYEESLQAYKGATKSVASVHPLLCRTSMTS